MLEKDVIIFVLGIGIAMMGLALWRKLPVLFFFAGCSFIIFDLYMYFEIALRTTITWVVFILFIFLAIINFIFMATIPEKIANEMVTPKEYGDNLGEEIQTYRKGIRRKRKGV